MSGSTSTSAQMHIMIQPQKRVFHTPKDSFPSHAQKRIGPQVLRPSALDFARNLRFSSFSHSQPQNIFFGADLSILIRFLSFFTLGARVLYTTVVKGFDGLFATSQFRWWIVRGYNKTKTNGSCARHRSFRGGVLFWDDGLKCSGFWWLRKKGECFFVCFLKWKTKRGTKT